MPSSSPHPHPHTSHPLCVRACTLRVMTHIYVLIANMSVVKNNIIYLRNRLLFRIIDPGSAREQNYGPWSRFWTFFGMSHFQDHNIIPCFKMSTPLTNLVVMTSSQEPWKFSSPPIKKPRRKLYLYQKGDYESMRKDTLEFAKENTSMVTRILVQNRRTWIC